MPDPIRIRTLVAAESRQAPLGLERRSAVVGREPRQATCRDRRLTPVRGELRAPLVRLDRYVLFSAFEADGFDPMVYDV